jgi:hypothetical protein
MSSPMPPQGQPVVVQKKTSIWVWILGGLAIFFCVIMVTCGLAAYMGMRMIKQAGFDSDLMKSNPGLAMAKMVTAMNKDYETVSSDDRKGTIVVREKSTGKVMTMKFDPATKQMVITTDDGKQAKVTIGDSGVTATTADGTVKFGSATGNDVPSWVPVYPGSKPQGTMSSTSADGSQNTITFESKDSPTKIVTFYSDQLKSAGFTINMTTIIDQGGTLVASDEGKKHTITISVGSSGDGTQTAINAVETK